MRARRRADTHAVHVLVLEVFVIGADDVQVAGDAVFGTDPKDLEDLVSATGTGAAQGVERIVIDRRQIGRGNLAVVDATGIVESEPVIDERRVLRVARVGELNPLIAGVKRERDANRPGRRNRAFGNDRCSRGTPRTEAVFGRH
jgi:hypothetical protein